MKLSGSSVVLASAALLPTAVLAQQTTTECSAVHVFLAKGNNEPYPGRQGTLIAAICGGIEGCDYEDVQWQNMLEDEYCGAVEQGAANGAAQIKAYNKRCPDTKLVLSGYSQGGHAIGDILGGGGGVFFQDCVQKENPALDRSSDAGKMIVAAMIFGDTRHTASQSYNYLSGASKDGLFPRPRNQLAGLNDYASVLRNWCVDTDPICAGGQIGETHLNYFDIYSGEAAAWVKEMVETASVGETSTTSKATSASSTSSAEETTSTEVEETTTTTTEVETTTEAETTSETSEVPESTSTEDAAEESSSAEETTTESTEVSTSAEPTTSDSGADSNSNADETTSSGAAAETEDNDDAAGVLVPSFGLAALGMIAMLGM